jgi:hypothetical protein
MDGHRRERQAGPEWAHLAKQVDSSIWARPRQFESIDRAPITPTTEIVAMLDMKIVTRCAYEVAGLKTASPRS